MSCPDRNPPSGAIASHGYVATSGVRRTRSWRMLGTSSTGETSTGPGGDSIGSSRRTSEIPVCGTWPPRCTTEWVNLRKPPSVGGVRGDSPAECPVSYLRDLEAAGSDPLAPLAVDHGAEGERDERGDESEKAEGRDDVLVVQPGRVEQIVEREEIDVVQHDEVSEPPEEGQDQEAHENVSNADGLASRGGQRAHLLNVLNRAELFFPPPEIGCG